MKRFQILHDAAPADGGTSQPATPLQASAPPPAEPPPEMPHTAQVVLTGQRSEREVELQAEIDELKRKLGGTEKEKKNREVRISELEDENRQLKLAREKPAPKKIVQTVGFWEVEEGEA